jgi:hypothetical protein
MREKLIEILRKAEWDDKLHWLDLYDLVASADSFADYLLANGVIVLPCKVGDTVWLLQKKCKHAGEKNEPWNVCDCYWENVLQRGMWGCRGKDENGNPIVCERKEMVLYAEEMEYSLVLYADHIVLGKNLFLTREDAEAALKEDA